MAMPRGLAVDGKSVADISRQAKAAPDKALRAAATQFEALFLTQLMKSMRAASPQDGPLDSDTTRTYSEMLDAQLAQSLASKGTGIADMLVKQLGKRVGGATPAKTEPLRMPQKSPDIVSSVRDGIANTANRFVETMRPYAERAAQTLGVPAQYLLAQAGLETGWGKSQPRAADGTPSHNLFGIKAGPGWTGKVVEAETTEYVGGKAVRTIAKFRAYDSPAQAFNDLASVLAKNRYASALSAGTADAYATQMQRAGYATDPAYGDKLARTIKAVTRRLDAAQTVTAQVSPRAADSGARSV